MNLCRKLYSKHIVAGFFGVRFFGTFLKPSNSGCCYLAHGVDGKRLLTQPQSDLNLGQGSFCRMLATQRDLSGGNVVGNRGSNRKGGDRIPKHLIKFGNLEKSLIVNVLGSENSDIWEMAGKREVRLLKQIENNKISDPEFIENVIAFSDALLDKNSTRRVALDKPKLLILLFASVFYPSQFRSAKVRAELVQTLDANMECFNVAELALVGSSIDPMKIVPKFSSSSISYIVGTLIRFLSSQTIAVPRVTFTDHLNLMNIIQNILKLMRNMKHIPHNDLESLLKTWNSLDAETCSLKRKGSVWSWLTLSLRTVPKDIAASVQFAQDLQKFAVDACQDHVRRTMLDQERYKSTDADKIMKFMIAIKDINRYLNFLRFEKGGLEIMNVIIDDKDPFYDILVDYLILNFNKECRVYPHHLLDILYSFAVAGYYPKVLIEKVVNDETIVQSCLRFRSGPDRVLFVNNGLKIERPKYCQFSGEHIHKALELIRADDSKAIMMQPVKEMDELVSVVEEIIPGASPCFIIRNRSNIFPYPEILVPFRAGKVCRIQPDRITDGFAGSRLPADVTLLDITFFAVGTINAGRDSGLYFAKKRQLGNLGILAFEMDARDLENGGSRLRQFIKDNKDRLF